MSFRGGIYNGPDGQKLHGDGRQVGSPNSMKKDKAIKSVIKRFESRIPGFVEEPKMEITIEQRRFLEDLWFIWGNGGPKHSMSNHKFIQGIIERGDDDRKFFKPDKDLIRVVDSILSSEVRRVGVDKCEKCNKRTQNEVNVSGRWAFWCGCP